MRWALDVALVGEKQLRVKCLGRKILRQEGVGPISIYMGFILDKPILE
jgi:hypothetical protein